MGDEIRHFSNNVVYQGGWIFYRPSACSLEFLSEMIQHGLNPNLYIRGNPYNIHSLNLAVELMSRTDTSDSSIQDKEHDGKQEKERRNVEASQNGTGRSPVAEDQVTPWCIVTALIKGGADIYHMNPWTFDRAQRWGDIWTPWEHASKNKTSYYWFQALLECGLDPIPTWREDMKRRKQALRSCGAWRTGMDERILDLPSSAGLRNRWCPRKDHSCGAIGYVAHRH